jgi:DNA topoisomerase-1
MKHVLKSLKHNGIYVPQYDYKQFRVKIRGETIPLTPKSEQMAVAWIRKRQSALAPPDKVFMRNFMREFLEQLKVENPSSEILRSFPAEYLERIENYEGIDLCDQKAPIHEEIDFSEISNYVEQEKQRKQQMTPEEKKQLAAERKAKREEFKAKYAVAEVDDQKLEIANWTAEPSCLFAGRGDHPQRGRWMEGRTTGRGYHTQLALRQR